MANEIDRTTASEFRGRVFRGTFNPEQFPDLPLADEDIAAAEEWGVEHRWAFRRYGCRPNPHAATMNSVGASSIDEDGVYDERGCDYSARVHMVWEDGPWAILVRDGHTGWVSQGQTTYYPAQYYLVRNDNGRLALAAETGLWEGFGRQFRKGIAYYQSLAKRLEDAWSR